MADVSSCSKSPTGYHFAQSGFCVHCGTQCEMADEPERHPGYDCFIEYGRCHHCDIEDRARRETARECLEIFNEGWIPEEGYNACARMVRERFGLEE